MLNPVPYRASMRWGAIATFAIALPACTNPSPPPPRLVCAIGPATPAPNTAGVLFFALTATAIDPTDSPDVPHTGFDLDGFVSTDTDPLGCTHPDYLSSLDPDQDCVQVVSEHCVGSSAICACPAATTDAAACIGAVDNQFPTLSNTVQTAFNIDMRASAADAMQHGRFVMLVELTDVDDVTDDRMIHARLFRGFAAPGTVCANPFAGGVYQIDRASLRAGGSTPDDAAAVLTGSITNRRVRVTASDQSIFPLQWPTSVPAPRPPFPLDTHHATLAMDLGADTASRGNFGGWIDTPPILAWTASVEPDLTAVALGVLDGLSDIQLNGVCANSTARPPILGGVSIGFGFEAVRVRLDPVNPVVDAPQSGSCENIAVSDAGRD